MNIVVLDGYTVNPGDLSWDGLKKMGALTIYDRTSHEDILKRCEGAEIIFTNKTPLSRETLSSLKSLKYIGVLATGYNVVDLQTLYENSDIISLHCPLFDDTKGMINKETIAQMKDGVIIINTSRGPLIVEEDLAEALNSGKVYAAAVDVLSTEPATKENPLITAKNCIITPHIAWAPFESRERLMNIAVDNLEKYLNNEPVNVVI